jgi:septum site-determining protein MinC
MPESNRVKIQIKGIKDGLLVTLGDGDWNDLQSEVLKHVEEKSSFFQGAKIVLDVGSREISASDLGTLRDRLADREVLLWACVSKSLLTERNSQMLGLATRLSPVAPEKDVGTPLESSMVSEGALLVQRTLRSGSKISFRGHVTVIGDVNPGAEIIAGGSIVVWGKLRGMVHAGADGDEAAVVCSIDLMPTQLRIAGRIAIPPKREEDPQPETASIKDNQVIAEPWIYK